MAKQDIHFLEDETVVKDMLEALDIKPADNILEIGPGTGIITKQLAATSAKVTAVEINNQFKERLDSINNVSVIYGNILELISAIPCKKLVSNLPFSITEPLLKILIKCKMQLAVLIIGKNFYETVLRKGKWSVIYPLFFSIAKLKDIPRASFSPKPRTDAVLVKLVQRTAPLVSSEKIIQDVVLQSDKKVKNALINAFIRLENLTQKQAKEKLASLKIPEKILGKNVGALPNNLFLALMKNIATC